MNSYLNEFAWDCWLKNGLLPTSSELESHHEIATALLDGELKVNDGYVSFSDYRNLIDKASAHLVNAILLPIINDPNSVFIKLHEVWCEEISDDGKLSGSALAMLHNQGQADLMDLAALAVPKSESIFNIIHVLEGAIPLINSINVDALFEFSRCSYDKLKRDLMGGRIYDIFMAWLINHETVAHKIIQTHIEQPEVETATLYSSALTVVSRINLNKGVNLALQHIKSDNYLVSAPAIDSLGFFQYTFPSDDKPFNLAINLAVDIVKAEIPNLLNAATNSLWRLVQQKPAEHGRLKHLVNSQSPEALYALSQFLVLNLDKYVHESWFADLIYACADVKPEQKGIVDNLDMVLSSLMRKDDKKEIAISYMEKWLQSRSTSELREINLETLFNSTFFEIIRSQRLSYIFTKWMCHESRELANGAYQLAGYLEVSGHKQLSYDLSLIDAMDADDLVFLIRRTLGYIYGESLLHSLIWSLTATKNANDRTLGMIHEIFTTRIGYDYPSDTVNFMQEKLASENLSSEAKNICNAIIQSINDYQKALDDLPRLNELKPPHSKVRKFTKERQKQMRKASESAQEKSVFAQLVTRIPLKAGRSSFSRRDNNYSEKMHLSSHSYSVSLPRSEVIDPVGSEMERLLFRNTRKATS